MPARTIRRLGPRHYAAAVHCTATAYLKMLSPQAAFALLLLLVSVTPASGAKGAKNWEINPGGPTTGDNDDSKAPIPPFIKTCMRASKTGLEPVQKMIDEVKADPDKLKELVNERWNNRHPICIAISRNDPLLLQLLIDSGADLKARGLNGQPPLHLAAWKGSLKVGALLVWSGADIMGPTTNTWGEWAYNVSKSSKYSDNKEAFTKMLDDELSTIKDEL